MTNAHWTVIAGLGLLALAGLFGAAHGVSPAAYWLGLGLFAAAFLLILGVVNAAFDRRPVFDIFPRQPRNTTLLLAVLAILGLIGLAVATSRDPALYWFGLGLFSACAVLAVRAAGALTDQTLAAGPPRH